jgi:GDP-L-fucose synthase
MRIIVTGGSGFVGSRLVERLEERGHVVCVPRSEYYDLRDSFDTKELFLNFTQAGDVDVVFHLAAILGGIGYNREHPAKLLYDNLTMGLNVIDYAWKFRVPHIIFTSSVCVYPKFTPSPFLENNLWEGYPEESNAAYGIAKRSVMELLKAYHKEYGMAFTCLLFTNLFGEGQTFAPEMSHVIPALIRKIDEAQKEGRNSIEVWGTGNASRDFLYVDDAVSALLAAMDNEPTPNPINIGSGKEVKIRDLVKTIAEIMAFSGDIIYDKTKPDGQPRRVLNINRAYYFLNWKPTMSLEDGLKRTVEWYRGLND